MRGREFRARDKKVQKLGRDGLVEQNKATGEERRVSQRTADISFGPERKADQQLGRQTSKSTQYGSQDFTVAPIEGLELADQLHDAIKYIRGQYREAQPPELEEGTEQERVTIPADPNVQNFSFAVVDGDVYFRENSIMEKQYLNGAAKDRVVGMVELRDCVRELIDLQTKEDVPDSAVREQQGKLNQCSGPVRCLSKEST